MRISKAQAQANRDRVVAAASELFRARGFDGVAVGELMKAAGFTHGGFYNHFGSKEALAVEALASAWASMADERARAGDLATLLPRYLSPAARKAPGKSCPAAALAGDVARQPAEVRQVFAEGLEGMIGSIEAQLAPGEIGGLTRRERAVDLVARMVGGLLLARAAPDDSPLAAEMLAAPLKTALREIESEPSRG